MSTILCVDADACVTALLSAALLREGHTVTVAHSGADALTAATRNPPAAILLDVNLPDADGLSLCALFRATLHVPVLIVTASHSDRAISAGFSHGADDYIGKPFTMEVLISRLRAVLRRARPTQTPRAVATSV